MTQSTQIPRRRTKIVANLAADKCDQPTIVSLIHAGTNLVQLDARDGERERLQHTYSALRAAAHEARNPIGVIADVGSDELTDRHRDDIRFLAEMGVDYVAAGPYRDAASIEDLRALLPAGASPTILAKVESSVTLAEAERVVGATDGLVIELDPMDAELPVVLRHVLSLARANFKPCVVSAAGSSGITSAVDLGVDAVLASPDRADDGALDAVAAADRVVRQLESNTFDLGLMANRSEEPDAASPEHRAIIRAALQLAEVSAARAVMVLPSRGSGFTARLFSAARPGIPIVGSALTLPEMLQMSILWGVIPRWIRQEDASDPEQVVKSSVDQLGLAGPGDMILAVDGLDESEDASEARLTIVTI